MPLRDHFRPPLADRRSWDSIHGLWPGMIVIGLNKTLPERYLAEPLVHLGATIEVDVATFEDEEIDSPSLVGQSREEGVATLAWSPSRPTLAVTTDIPNVDEYEVRVYDMKSGRRLVAAIELVSPSNKDRPENRRAFVAKCAEMMRNGVCVAIVDLMTTRASNLYADLLELLGQTDPSLTKDSTPLYAASCRWTRIGEDWQLQAWNYPLALGQPLPILPVWLAENLAVPLELEVSYEETCRVLRIA